ncbi:MAG: SUMF1/EgtB/PvdO family nonheme iron enzyme, partial [Oscillospiraceae bacterium]
MMIKKILLFLTVLLLFVQAIAAQKVNKDIINRMVSNMVVVNGGEFTMGFNDPYSSSLPQEHVVTLTEYRIGRYVVTQKEWVAVMGSNPSEVKSDNLPVTNISWYD